MDLQHLLNSRRAGETVLLLSRVLPPKIGYWFADRLAGRVAASKHTPLVRAIRANQWVISRQTLSAQALDAAVLATIRNLARSFYTLFHYLYNLDAIQGQIDYSEQAERILELSQTREQGVIVVGLHMSSFDLVAQAAARRGLRALALSLPQPDRAVEWQHEFRRQAGIEILPASVSTIRYAIERLRAGHVVLTGIDRPAPQAKYRPFFFGLPAVTPVHYIQLALKARVPLSLMASIQREDGSYQVLSSELIYLDSYKNRAEEILCNAEKILAKAEDFIRLAPHQWTVFQPVWPETISQMPE